MPKKSNSMVLKLINKYRNFIKNFLRSFSIADKLKFTSYSKININQNYFSDEDQSLTDELYRLLGSNVKKNLSPAELENQVEQFSKYLEADIEEIRNEKNLAKIEMQKQNSPRVHIKNQARDNLVLLDLSVVTVGTVY